MKAKHYFATLIVALLPLSDAIAGQCLRGHTEDVLLSGDSKAIARTQASNTWEDWIWRGAIFKCPTGSGGVQACGYTLGETKTTSYSWAGNVGLNLSGIPVVGGVLGLFNLSGSYNRQQSMSTSYTWEVKVNPGYFAQPIQVVVRRWTEGYYRGASVRDPSLNCSTGIAAPVAPNWYNWDSNRTAGKWTANIEQSRYATYYVHR